MASRQNLHLELINKLPNIKVFYQPPSKLPYPCLLYDLDDIETLNADNIKYRKIRRYKLTYISTTIDPTVNVNGEERLVEDVLLEFPYCSFDRYYNADNLHHYVFTLYY